MKKKRIYFACVAFIVGLLITLLQKEKKVEEKSLIVPEVKIIEPEIPQLNIPKLSEEDNEYFEKFKKYTTVGIDLFLEENQELKSVKKLFYPFSGGDILYPLTLFPNVEEIYMASMEPIGTQEIKEIEKLSEHTKSLASRSFLVTRDMRSTLSESFGILNMIVEELSLIGVQKFIIEDFNTEKQSFKISFNYKERERKIIYTKSNLNDFLFDKSFFKKIVDEYAFDCVMVKSASYLMHDESPFTKIRTFLLENFEMIVEDDSGIPYRYLKTHFNVKLIGEYKKPYGSEFKRFLQPDLAKVNPFSKNVIKCYGYGGGKVTANVIIAKRKI